MCSASSGSSSGISDGTASAGGTARARTAASSSRPCPVALEVTTTGTSSPRHSRHSRGRRLRRLRGHEVGLGQGKHPRKRRQPRLVGGELALDHGVVGHRVRPVQRRQVEHVDEEPRALDVRQEVVPQPGAVAGAHDQARDVGEDELAVTRVKRAQHRRERGERVVGHLGLGPRQRRQQRRLAGVGHADQPDVGQQLEPQLDPPPPRRTGRARRSAAPGVSTWRSACCLVRLAAARHHRPPAWAHQVVARPVEPRHLGAGRHPHLERLPARAVAQRALAVATARRLPVDLAAEGLEVAQRVVADEHDIPPRARRRRRRDRPEARGPAAEARAAIAPPGRPGRRPWPCRARRQDDRPRVDSAGLGATALGVETQPVRGRRLGEARWRAAKVPPQARQHTALSASAVSRAAASAGWWWRASATTLMNAARATRTSEMARWKRPASECGHGSSGRTISRPRSESACVLEGAGVADMSAGAVPNESEPSSNSCGHRCSSWGRSTRRARGRRRPAVRQR